LVGLEGIRGGTGVSGTYRHDPPGAQQTDADLGQAEQQRFALARDVAAQLRVEDGRVLVETLFQAPLQRAAPHDASWNGTRHEPNPTSPHLTQSDLI